MSPEKRPDRAIEIAKRSGVKLKIAAKVDAVNRDYFEQQIEPLLDHPLIEFIGEIDEDQKSAFLGGAMALLFPIDWMEPFGLVMIESMSAGTPVIAWRNGSVPEVIQDGESGFIVESMDEAVEAVSRIPSLGRAMVRRYFKSRFTAARMAQSHVAAYEKLIALSKHKTKSAVHIVPKTPPPIQRVAPVYFGAPAPKPPNRFGSRRSALHAIPSMKTALSDRTGMLAPSKVGRGEERDRQDDAGGRVPPTAPASRTAN